MFLLELQLHHLNLEANPVDVTDMSVFYLLKTVYVPMEFMVQVRWTDLNSLGKDVFQKSMTTKLSVQHSNQSIRSELSKN